MKGVYERRTPQPKYSVIWDASKVLNYLASLHPLKDLSLKDLTHKLLMLLLLVTGQRGQSIHMLTLEHMTLTESACDFQLPGHTKTSKPGQPALSISVQKFAPDPKICPLKALQEYLDRTQELRSGEQRLFISFVRPYKAVSRDTISRWTKTVLRNAGIDTTQFTSHSTRAAVASKAKQKEVPLDVILSHVGWRSADTFKKFYDKPVLSNCTDLASVILHS